MPGHRFHSFHYDTNLSDTENPDLYKMGGKAVHFGGGNIGRMANCP